MESLDLNQILITLVGVLAAWATKELATWLRGRAKNEREKALVDQLEKLVSTTVGSLSQTLVKTAKTANCWDADCKQTIKLQARRFVKSSLSKKNLKGLSEVFGNEHLDRLIEAMIENQVLKDNSINGQS
jgi:hypothetical protein